MDIKYTKDGRKVAVLGKLNNEQWIVQEIFMSGDKEFPAGENFVEKTLLDEKAETYADRRIKELEQQKNRLITEIEKLEKERRLVVVDRDAARDINSAIEKYRNIDIDQLETLFAFLSGEITHFVIDKWRHYKIQSTVDAVKYIDNGYGQQYEGLKLVSLFGCRKYNMRHNKDETMRLDWKIDRYPDGSGHGSYKAYPCKSLDEAIKKLDSLIYKEENINQEMIDLKYKFNLVNPTQDKIDAFNEACLESAEKRVEKAKDTLKIEKDKLKELKCQHTQSNK